MSWFRYPTVQKWKIKVINNNSKTQKVVECALFYQKNSIWQMISFLNHENCQVQKSLVELIVEGASFFFRRHSSSYTTDNDVTHNFWPLWGSLTAGSYKWAETLGKSFLIFFILVYLNWATLEPEHHKFSVWFNAVKLVRFF